jgi:positive regulator of sigma E activity
LVIVLFILGRTTGYELNHPGAFVVGMSAIIWILSLYGMFTFNGLTQYPFFNQYIFALITSCIGAGYGISVIRRYSG